MNLCLTCALILGLLNGAEVSRVNKPNFLRIRNGMSRQDVDAILGKPAGLCWFGCGTCRPGREVDVVTGIPVFTSLVIWISGDMQIVVLFDKKGEVVESQFKDWETSPVESSGQKRPATRPKR